MTTKGIYDQKRPGGSCVRRGTGLSACLKRAALAACVVLSCCGKPREIPEKSLESIFKDIFLVNAYVGRHGLDVDSLDIYKPVFDKYGYKPRDLAYTLDNYSKRKSSRLSYILENSIKMLNSEYSYYEGRVAVLDTIENVARRRFGREVYSDTLISVRRMRDTARLRIRIPAAEGSFRIRYGYLVDSLDTNYSLRTIHSVTDSSGRQVVTRSNWMKRNEYSSYETVIDAPARSRYMEILFGDYSGRNARPSIRIDTLTITYYMPVRVALDSLNRSLVDYKLMIDGTEYELLGAPDSVTLGIHPPGLAPRGDSIR